ncbi:MerR family transcriptional regulator [Actinocatenispora rupis]|uniref:MerR family transcriptional regulator n=1 Tax=Actinocatenispora rupis TaxID=519421 RepID=A0A8J3JI00_9ACTN|nr:MerR family transcriptional regulator [Actinocatenispora rupis]GID16228.1 MerR family transcriptional regulator [Actinocatenispora rupis]
MRIGELAAAAGTSTRMLRYYEQQGLLPDHRDGLGHRAYGAAELRLVQEILALQRIGFTLAEARPFVDCLRAGHDSGDACPASLEVYERKLADLDALIATLTAARRQVRTQHAAALARRTADPADPRCQFDAVPTETRCA